MNISLNKTHITLILLLLSRHYHIISHMTMSTNLHNHEMYIILNYKICNIRKFIITFIKF